MFEILPSLLYFLVFQHIQQTGHAALKEIEIPHPEVEKKKKGKRRK